MTAINCPVFSIALCRIALHDISSDDEEVSGDNFDGDGVNEDEDKDVVLEVQVDKQHEQEGVVAFSENKTLPSSQQHSISSGLQ